MATIATVDLRQWRAGGAAADEVCRLVDEGLRRAGFLLVTGHGINPELPARVRQAARYFFRLPSEVKQQYASTQPGLPGWLGPGLEANGYSEGTATPPDMKETLGFQAQTPTGDRDVDRRWFNPNVWPAEIPELRGLYEIYLVYMERLTHELLTLCAVALGQRPDALTALAHNAMWSSNINHYPPLTVTGPAQAGQFRIGPHTDFGTVTILDREPGAGGLQVYTDEAGWEDAPFDPAALTVNIGDILAYWTGHRWRSGRHRVLAPPVSAPDEELISLIYFHDLSPEARVVPLAKPVAVSDRLEPVVAGEYLAAKIDAISL